jgi:plastocyanin
MDRRSFLRTGALIGCSAGVAGCVGGAGGSVEYDVGMTTRRFDPARIEIEAGETVVWRNTSSHAHTITAYEAQLPDGVEFWSTGDLDTQAEAEVAWRQRSGGALYQGDRYEREFTTPGEHPYFCIPHETSGMAGVVIVEG